jgi:signal peptidase II
MRAVAFLLTAILLVLIDQAAKAIVVSRFREGQATACGAVGIRRTLNRRGCGGFVKDGRVLVAMWAGEIVVLAALVQFGPILPGATAPVALGAALGGASSNLFDRLWRGGVVDFIDLGFWPVFNLADVAIVAGVVVALVCL